jgi:hypothetical protein
MRNKTEGLSVGISNNESEIEGSKLSVKDSQSRVAGPRLCKGRGARLSRLPNRAVCRLLQLVDEENTSLKTKDPALKVGQIRRKSFIG